MEENELGRCSTCKNYKKPKYRSVNTRIGHCKKLKEEHFKFWKQGHKSIFEIFIQFGDLSNFEIEVSEDFGCILHNK